MCVTAARGHNDNRTIIMMIMIKRERERGEEERESNRANTPSPKAKQVLCGRKQEKKGMGRIVEW